MPFPVLLFLGACGLCVGSFVNVLILRFGFDERPSQRSLCMACNTRLAWHDLLPIVSFFALRGRCRTCGSRLLIQYPLVEFSVATLFVLSGIYMPPVLSFWPLAAFAALLFFLAAFTALVVYDARHTLVPMPFVYALIGSALVASIAQSFFSMSPAPLYDSATGGAVLFAFFMAIVLITRGRGMGAGDAYVALAIGILFGFERGIEVVMVGVWAGTIVGLLMLFLSSVRARVPLFMTGARVTMKTELPLVPFLAFGTLIGLFTNFSPLQTATGISNFFLSGHL